MATDSCRVPVALRDLDESSAPCDRFSAGGPGLLPRFLVSQGLGGLLTADSGHRMCGV